MKPRIISSAVHQSQVVPHKHPKQKTWQIKWKQLTLADDFLSSMRSKLQSIVNYILTRFNLLQSFKQSFLVPICKPLSPDFKGPITRKPNKHHEEKKKQRQRVHLGLSQVINIKIYPSQWQLFTNRLILAAFDILKHLFIPVID